MLVCAPMHTAAQHLPRSRVNSFVHRFEGGVLVVAFLLSMLIPLIDDAKVTPLLVLRKTLP